MLESIFPHVNQYLTFVHAILNCYFFRFIMHIVQLTKSQLHGCSSLPPDVIIYLVLMTSSILLALLPKVTTVSSLFQYKYLVSDSHYLFSNDVTLLCFGNM